MGREVQDAMGVTLQWSPAKVSQESDVGSLRNREQQLGVERGPRINFSTSLQKC